MIQILPDHNPGWPLATINWPFPGSCAAHFSDTLIHRFPAVEFWSIKQIKALGWGVAFFLRIRSKDAILVSLFLGAGHRYRHASPTPHTRAHPLTCAQTPPLPHLFPWCFKNVMGKGEGNEVVQSHKCPARMENRRFFLARIQKDMVNLAFKPLHLIGEPTDAGSSGPARAGVGGGVEEGRAKHFSPFLKRTLAS